MTCPSLRPFRPLLLPLALLAPVALLLAGCGGGDDDDVGPTGSDPVSVAIEPADVQLLTGESAPLRATATYPDGSTGDVTAQAAWRTSDEAIATVDGTGAVHAVAPGSVTIQATLGGVTGAAHVAVGSAGLRSLAITPGRATVPAGFTQAFVATGTLEDGSTEDMTAQVTWSSSDPAVATVSNDAASAGVASGVSAGEATVLASFGSLEATAILDVTSVTLSSIAVAPAETTVPVGMARALTATGSFQDGSSRDVTADVTWSSSDPAVATVSATGEVQGVAAGSVTITAALGDVSGTASVTVAAIDLVTLDVSPSPASVGIGFTVAFTALGHFSDASTQDLTAQVEWSSSDEGVATISAAGVASGLAAGTTTITATSGLIRGTASLTAEAITLSAIAVTPGTGRAGTGDAVAFVATGTFSNGSQADVTSTVVWSTGDAAIASVSNAAGSQGIATALGAGTTSVTATSDLVSGSAALHVVRGARVVTGDGLVLQDVAPDGLELAYTDAGGTLYLVPTAGGDARSVAANVERARYRGRTLAILRGIDATGKTAATLLTVNEGGAGPAAVVGTSVKIKSLRASFDGLHFAFEQANAADPTLDDLVLDGVVVVTGAKKLKARFSPANDYLIVGDSVTDAGGNSVRTVTSIPLGGGAATTLVASGASTRTDVTPDGAEVVVGANRQAGIVDLEVTPITGGGVTVLATSASETGFRVLDDGATLVYLNPDDPAAPSTYSLERIGLDGASHAVLVASGLVDTLTASTDAVIYATAVDANGLYSMRFVRSTGADDLALGSRGVDEGFGSDGAHYLFRDQVVANGLDLSGRLRVLSVADGAITDLGTDVVKGSYLGAATAALLDSAGLLSTADLVAATTAAFEDAVGAFTVVPDAVDGPASRIAFSIPAGGANGVYVAAAP